VSKNIPVGGKVSADQAGDDQPVQPRADQHHRRDGWQLDVRPDHEPVGFMRITQIMFRFSF
jgi:hypothetical protein